MPFMMRLHFWTDPSLYDLVINIGQLTLEDAVDIICHQTRLKRFQNVMPTFINGNMCGWDFYKASHVLNRFVKFIKRGEKNAGVQVSGAISVE